MQPLFRWIRGWKMPTYWGIDYFMRKTDTKVVFPMHFWGKYETIDCLIRQKETEDYRDRIAEIDWKGERFSI